LTAEIAAVKGFETLNQEPVGIKNRSGPRTGAMPNHRGDEHRQRLVRTAFLEQNARASHAAVTLICTAEERYLDPDESL